MFNTGHTNSVSFGGVRLPMPLRIRPAQPADSAALHMVCLQTGSAGDDATDEFRTDPDALGTSDSVMFGECIVNFALRFLLRPLVHTALSPVLSSKFVSFCKCGVK